MTKERGCPSAVLMKVWENLFSYTDTMEKKIIIIWRKLLPEHFSLFQNNYTAQYLFQQKVRGIIIKILFSRIICVPCECFCYRRWYRRMRMKWIRPVWRTFGKREWKSNKISICGTRKSLCMYNIIYMRWWNEVSVCSPDNILYLPFLLI